MHAIICWILHTSYADKLKCHSLLPKLNPHLRDNMPVVGGHLQHEQVPVNQKHLISIPSARLISSAVLPDNYSQMSPNLKSEWVLTLMNHHRHHERNTGLTTLSDHQPFSADSADEPLVYFCAAQTSSQPELPCIAVTSVVAAGELTLNSCGNLSYDSSLRCQGLSHTDLCSCDDISMMMIKEKLISQILVLRSPVDIEKNMSLLASSSVVSVSLDKLYPNVTLTDEILQSRHAENLINSRPITRVSDEPLVDALTPNHLLVMQGNSPHSLVGYDDSKIVRSQWKQVTQLTENFWRRWHAEYLHTLQQRQKWNRKLPNIKVGELVMLVEPNLARGQWPLGIIEKLKPSSDGLIRSVSVRTAASTYDRPLGKLVKLELDCNDTM